MTDGGESFGAELRRLRVAHGLSLAGLAELVHYSRGYLGKIETGDKPPTLDLARACDDQLGADGHLLGLISVVGLPQVAQLPAAPVTFVGREELLEHLLSVLAERGAPGSPRIVAVDGPPGVGKTALALRLAHLARSLFPDGQLFVNLRGFAESSEPARPAGVLEDFLLSLGVQAERVPEGLDQRAALYRSMIDRRRVLVVLDNALEFDQVAPLLPASASCGVILTSRGRLAELEVEQGQRATLEPLTEDDARVLVGSVIGVDRAERESAAVGLLAERCGHLPLALRVAADLVALHPYRAVDALVGDLDDERDRLDVLGGSKVRAVLSWSYHRLDVEQGRLFRLLGLYPGTFISTGAAAALAARPLAMTRRLLDALVSAHLVEAGPEDRYQLHDLLRVYAMELVEEESDTVRGTARDRLVEWFWHSTYRANTVLAPQRPNPDVGVPRFDMELPDVSDHEAALRWCELELPNLVPLTRVAGEIEHWEAAWKIPVTWWNFLHLRKRWSAWTMSHHLGLDSARQGTDETGEAWLSTNLAVAYRETGRREEARALLDRALVLRRRTDDAVGESWTLTALGFIHADRGEFEAAARRFADALAVRDRIAAAASSDVVTTGGNKHGQCIALASLGAALTELGSIEEALEHLHRALSIANEIGERHGASFTMIKLTDAYRRQGRTEIATETGRRALELSREVGDLWGEGEVLQHLGRVHMDGGQVALAVEVWQLAEEVFDELGDPRAAEVRGLLADVVDDSGAPG